MVHLKYGPVLKLVSIEKKADGSIDYLKVEANENCTSEEISKLKGHIHWVSKSSALPATVNLYALLFTEENPLKLGDNWPEAVNPDSLIVCRNAKIWDLQKKAKVEDRFQFERLAYFILDRDSDPKKKNVLLKRTSSTLFGTTVRSYGASSFTQMGQIKRARKMMGLPTWRTAEGIQITDLTELSSSDEDGYF